MSETHFLREIMNIDAESLKKRQYEAIKRFAINRLGKVVDYLKNDNLDAVVGMTGESPAGDGMGSDSYFIDFGFGDQRLSERLNGREDGSLDIVDIINLLKSLRDGKGR